MTGEAVALANPWEQIKAQLTTRISARAYEDWVTRTAFDGSEGLELVLAEDAPPDCRKHDRGRHGHAANPITTARTWSARAMTTSFMIDLTQTVEASRAVNQAGFCRNARIHKSNLSPWLL